MNIVSYYVSRASYTEVLKGSFEKYDCNRDNVLNVFTSKADLQNCLEWVATLRPLFKDVNVVDIATATATKDSEVDQFVSDCFMHLTMRCPLDEGEFLVLHPFEVGDSKNYPVDMLMELRKSKKPVWAIGDINEDGGADIKGSYITTKEWLARSDVRYRMIPRGMHVYKALEFVVRQSSELDKLESVSFLKSVAEARVSEVTEIPAIGGLAPAKKRPAKKGTKKKAAKKTAKKKSARVIEPEAVIEPVTPPFSLGGNDEQSS